MQSTSKRDRGRCAGRVWEASVRLADHRRADTDLEAILRVCGLHGKAGNIPVERSFFTGHSKRTRTARNTPEGL